MTTKQQLAVKKMVVNGGKITGKEMEEIGYSKAMAKNPKKLMQSPVIENEMTILLHKHNLTLDRALKPISDALDATKVVILGNKEDAFADVIPDLDMRMRASDRVIRLLGKDRPQNQQMDNTDIKEALQGDMDEVELTRAVFKRKDAL